MELDVEQLYRRYGDMVLGRCRQLLRNEADAQECMQDVFLKAWRYRASFRGEASPTTWLFKTTTTTCLNWLRTRSRRREDITDELPPGAHAGDGLLDGLEMKDLVQRLLAEEDEGTREALIYVYVDGMTHDEAGLLLGVTGAAIRKRLSTFRARLGDSPPKWFGEVT